MNIKLKRVIALLAAFSLVIACVAMYPGTVKAQAEEEKILDITSGWDIWHAQMYYLHGYKGTITDTSDRNTVFGAIDEFYDNLTEEEEEEWNAKCDDFIFDKIEVGNSVLGSEDGSGTDLYSSVSTKQIRVASGGAICLNSEVFVQKIDIKGTGSVIDGKLTVFDNTTDNAYNRLVINEDSDLTLSKDSETVVKGSGCIEVWDGATLNINGYVSVLDGACIDVYNEGTLNINGSVKTDNGGCIGVGFNAKVYEKGKALVVYGDRTGKALTLDGSQEESIDIRLESGKWIYREIRKDITLPDDWDEYDYAFDKYYGDYRFDKVTFSKSMTIDSYYILANEFVIPEGVTLTLKCKKNRDENGNVLDNGFRDEEGILFDGWIAELYADKITVAGTVIIENSDIINIHYDPDNYWSQRYNRCELHFYKECTVTDTGKIIAKGNGIFTTDWNALVTINVPSFDAIVTDEVSCQTGPYSTINIGGKPWMITCVSGNEGDDTVHDIYIDGHYPFSVYFYGKGNGTWELDGPIWWGEPLDNEYRVLFDKGGVKVNGTEISTDDFIKFTEGEAIEFEIIPPEGSTETPLVFINTGYYGRDIDTEYRSDDYKASDLWYKNVKRITLNGNKYSFTPKTSNAIEFVVFYGADDVMNFTIDELDNTYKWSGDYYKDAWRWNTGFNPQEYDEDDVTDLPKGYGLDKGWDVPGNEFIVDVSVTGKGDFETTPGINFCRIGKRAKVMYQGFELYTDIPAVPYSTARELIEEGEPVPFERQSVDITFIPDNGYQMSYIVIDGKYYDPANVKGLSYSNGVYTYKITETPTTDSDIIGNRADDRTYREAVKIITISAAFTAIQAPVITSAPDPVVTQSPVTTPVPEATTPTPSPEVTVTDNKDGSTTTTTIIENKDGSTTTKEVTKEKDGTVTTTEVTESKDGSVTTETEVKNQDGSKEVETKVENPDGSIRTELEVVDRNGKVLMTSEQETSVNSKGTEIVTTKIENADGSSSESVVKTTAAGKVVSETVEVDKKGNLSITLETDKPDGAEVKKSFESTDGDGIKLTDYDTKGSTAVIPGEIKVGDTSYTVTTIGKNAMAGNLDIKKVKIPESVTVIGKGAFQNAKNLKKIELGSDITKVSKNAFAGIAKNAVIKIKASAEDFERIVTLIKKSGVDKSVQFKRVK